MEEVELEQKELESLTDDEIVAIVEHGVLAFLYKGAVTWPIIQAIDTRASMAHTANPDRLLPSTALLGLAASLGLEELCQAVQHHKIQSLHIANAVSELSVSRFYDLCDLEKASKAFLVNHFASMVASPPSFSGLKRADFIEIVSDDNLSVAEERTVFWGIVAWVESNNLPIVEFDALMPHVRLPLLPFEDLEEIETSQWPPDSAVLRNKLNAAYRYRAAPPEKREALAVDLELSQTQHRARSYSFI